MWWHEGDVVRKLRTSAGMTLEQLSRVSGVSVQVINRLETGRTRDPKTATLTRLAQALNPTWTANDLRNAVPGPHMLVLRPAKPRGPRAAHAHTRHKRKRA